MSGARRLSPRQLRYLWAVGYFKNGVKAKTGTDRTAPVKSTAIKRSKVEAVEYLESRFDSVVAAHNKRAEWADNLNFRGFEAYRKARKKINPDLPKEEREKLLDEIGDRAEAIREASYRAKNKTIAHSLIEDLRKAQGFDGKPRLATRQEIESDDSLIPMYRGVADASISAKQIVDRFRTGRHDVGSGIYGAGTYTAEKFSVAETYSQGAVTFAMGLPKSARIIEFDELDRLSREAKFETKHRELGYQMDHSSLAVAMGYDATYVRGSGYYVIHNRSILVVEKD